MANHSIKLATPHRNFDVLIYAPIAIVALGHVVPRMPHTVKQPVSLHQYEPRAMGIQHFMYPCTP